MHLIIAKLIIKMTRSKISARKATTARIRYIISDGLWNVPAPFGNTRNNALEPKNMFYNINYITQQLGDPFHNQLY